MDRPEVIRQEQNYVIAVLQKATGVLGGMQVRPLLENHSDFTADEYVRIVEEVGPESMGVFLDVINPITMFVDPKQVVDRLLPWATAGHVKDYRFQSVFVEDGFHRRGYNVEYCYPGEGVADLNGLVGQISGDPRLETYWLSIEGLNNYRGVADQAHRLQSSIATIRGILSNG